ncbi:MAG: hypothetical protein WD407_07055 [Rhodospirillales bacterium]
MSLQAQDALEQILAAPEQGGVGFDRLLKLRGRVCRQEIPALRR